MAATIGLRLVLTVYGFIDHVLPHLLRSQARPYQLRLDTYLSHILLRIRFHRSHSQFLLRQFKHGIINRIRPPTSPLLQLPYEVREQIYVAVCAPDTKGRIDSAHNLLLINKQICAEARPFLENIEHTIVIGDLQRYQRDDTQFWGSPFSMHIDNQLNWHLNSLHHLVLSVAVVGIGTMTPDCFDVVISHNAKDQWRNMKRLIGIWPEIRDMPLESIRLDLRVSEYSSKWKTYRADFIRVIRNFKRTRVWAETGDGSCEVRRGNKSVLLPLVRAFNQGRRNWVKQSDVDNNLIVRYDSHMLSKSIAELKAKEQKGDVETEYAKWNIVPTDDTSRSDSAVWPEWTGKEEKYIHDKMLLRDRNGEDEFECQQCLAVFEKPGELRRHAARGRNRAQQLETSRSSKQQSPCLGCPV